MSPDLPMLPDGIRSLSLGQLWYTVYKYPAKPDTEHTLLAMVPSIVTASGDTRNGNAVRNGISASANMDGYRAFDHVLWYVGNAKQAASYYVARLGFKHVAYVLLPPFLSC